MVRGLSSIHHIMTPYIEEWGRCSKVNEGKAIKKKTGPETSPSRIDRKITGTTLTFWPDRTRYGSTGPGRLSDTVSYVYISIKLNVIKHFFKFPSLILSACNKSTGQLSKWSWVTQSWERSRHIYIYYMLTQTFLVPGKGYSRLSRVLLPLANILQLPGWKFFL